MDFNIRTNQNCLVATDEYLDKNLPFKMQHIVSQTLHAFIDPKQRRKLIEWEETRFRLLKNEGALNDSLKYDYEFNYKINSEDMDTEEEIKKIEKVTSEKLDTHIAAIKQNRLSFLNDWNVQRKQNEEFMRKVLQEQRKNEAHKQKERELEMELKANRGVIQNVVERGVEKKIEEIRESNKTMQR